MPMNTTTTSNFKNTMKSLKRELPCVPPARMSERSTTMAMAGTLMIPPSAGHAVNASGSSRPISFIIMQK